MTLSEKKFIEYCKNGGLDFKKKQCFCGEFFYTSRAAIVCSNRCRQEKFRQLHNNGKSTTDLEIAAKIMKRNYILEGKEPKQVDNILEWARWVETGNRIVEKTEISDVKISTVFLGFDHSFGGGTPLLFETKIFGGAEDGYQDRYSTWDEAVKGHQLACEKVKNGKV